MRRERWQKIRERISSLPPPSPEKQKPSWREARSTERAYRSYRRRQLGIRSVNLLISEDHLDSLVHLGLLSPDLRKNRTEIQNALSAHLNASLITRFSGQLWVKIARENRARQTETST